jgi:hypothetical protein
VSFPSTYLKERLRKRQRDRGERERERERREGERRRKEIGKKEKGDEKVRRFLVFFSFPFSSGSLSLFSLTLYIPCVSVSALRSRRFPHK